MLGKSEGTVTHKYHSPIFFVLLGKGMFEHTLEVIDTIENHIDFDKDLYTAVFLPMGTPKDTHPSRLHCPIAFCLPNKYIYQYKVGSCQPPNKPYFRNTQCMELHRRLLHWQDILKGM